MHIATPGINIGKTWFDIIGLDPAGKPVPREKLNRQKCSDPVKTCSGVNLSGETLEHIDGRRDHTLDGAP